MLYKFGYIVLFLVLCTDAVYYDYVKYSYKKKRDDKLYRMHRTACEAKQVCQHSELLRQSACIRECISPVCYSELYKHDLLEEGEIDVRFNSFKGCLQKHR